VIAEVGVNHNGEIERGLEMVRVAAAAGADAVKFQTFQASALVAPGAEKATYQKIRTDPDETQQEMLRRLELSDAAHHVLADSCRQHGIQFLSTPFDYRSADFLADLDVPAFKMSSGDLTDLPFLAHVAAKGKPMLVSTGMASLEEVAAALRAVRDVGNDQIVLLHCVSNYPANAADVNLRAMGTMAASFGTPVGYSDHVLGSEVALAAVALGACVVEKHFTLDRGLPGPDHAASAEPDELCELVRSIRLVESAMGDGRKIPARHEAGTAAVARKSLMAKADIPAGAVLTHEMVVAMRPGTGLPPAALPELLGRTSVAEIPAGTMLRRELFA
jgi:N,N'-diacetyllegionaminate synthase